MSSPLDEHAHSPSSGNLITISSGIWYWLLILPISLSMSLEGTPSAMKGLFRSRTKMGIRGSWDTESDEDDSVVSEDRPWLPRSSDPDIGVSEPPSLEDDDSEESPTPRAIKTRDKGPKGNAALNLAARTYRNKEKRVKAKPFVPQPLKTQPRCKKKKNKTKKE